MSISLDQNAPSSSGWLKSYYFARFAFSAIWVLTAFTVVKNLPPLAAVMLVVYPLWDALANFADARRNGGLAQSPTQALNVAISVITAIAVAGALAVSMNTVLIVFGAWASLSGLLQLATGVRRWKSGAQWAMVLSGAQSALAGAFFVKMAASPAAPVVVIIAPYAAFGAFYFLVSAIWLTVADSRRSSVRAAR